jgi:uncharacterized protein (DUF111 family)
MTRSPSILLLAQVDHACGDVVASVTEELLALGVQNVNLVPSLTKKGRPGYLLFVDLPETLLGRVEQVLATELGILGWRILSAEHRKARVRESEQQVSVLLGAEEHVLDVPVKFVETEKGYVPVSIEHEFCRRLRQQLREDHGVEVPLQLLKSRASAHRRPQSVPCPSHRPSIRAKETRRNQGRVLPGVWPEQERGRLVDDNGR